jgi:MoaA/NifB/PqqE/SkfB family radical SAM enzyme
MNVAATAGSLAKLVQLGGAIALKRRRPFSVTFILTHRCNFRCDYCDIPDAADEEMSTAEFCAAIDELAACGMARASFSGGEALLRRDAIEIIAHAKSRGLFTSLNSNAWLTGRHIDRLSKVLDMLVMSLDGPREIHDLVRKREGSFDRVIEAIDLAKESGISVATISVLGPWNLHAIPDILRLAQQHSFWSYFQPAYSDCFNQNSGIHSIFTPELFDRVAGQLQTAKAHGLPVGASPTYLKRLAEGPEFGDCSTCAAGSYFATVMPDGVMVPCHLTSQKAIYPNGRKSGFANAFRQMPLPPPGPGCAISPYQESDLIFGLDGRAILDAARRAWTSPRPAVRGLRHAVAG